MNNQSYWAEMEEIKESAFRYIDNHHDEIDRICESVWRQIRSIERETEEINNDMDERLKKTSESLDELLASF